MTKFLKEVPGGDLAARLPSAIVITGPSIASHGAIFEQIARRVTKTTSAAFVNLASNQASNLKTLLKHLIAAAAASSVSHYDEDGDDDAPTSSRKGRGLLNYDLGNLQHALKERQLDRVVVVFQDSEAFDGDLLSRTIELLQ